MEIRRFGPGHRRPDGPPGTHGVTGQVIHHDARGLVAELALGRHARITPHTNPNTAYFVVISGGGYVQVGEETARVVHGEAVLWPAGELHGAYTDGTEMRAIVVEFPAPGGELASNERVRAIEGRRSRESERTPPGAEPESAPVERGRGGLAERPTPAPRPDDSSGEPW